MIYQIMECTTLRELLDFLILDTNFFDKTATVEILHCDEYSAATLPDCFSQPDAGSKLMANRGAIATRHAKYWVNPLNTCQGIVF